MSGKLRTNIFSGLEQIVEKDYSLSEKTWFGLGGKAEFFIQPQTVEQLADVVRRCSENNISLRVLGYGSNLLIRDEGVKGVVIKLDGEEFCKVEQKEHSIIAVLTFSIFMLGYLSARINSSAIYSALSSGASLLLGSFFG